MNTMKDLKQIVHRLLYESIDGRKFDQYKNGKVEISHMLGIVPVGTAWLYEDFDDTILDPDYDFWNDYSKEVTTYSATESEITDALQILREAGQFEVTYPYGEEAEIVYTEVEKPKDYPECVQCGEDVHRIEESYECRGMRYALVVKMKCQCGYQQSFERVLEQL